MPQSRPPSVGDTFWRCRQCGTPNPSASYLTHCVGCGGPRPAVRTDAIRPVSSPAERSDARPALFRRALAAATWAHAVLVVGILGVMWTLGDRWWPATALLYMPRWVWLLPLLVLAPASLAARGARVRLLGIQGATALVVAGPLMGFHVPWGRWPGGRPEGTTIRIMTLNRQLLGADAGAISDLVERERIDLVCFQETDDRVPIDPVFLWGWSASRDRTIFSRFPIVAELEESDLNAFPEYGFWPVRHRRVVVRLPDGSEVVVGSAHMPTPRSGLSLYLSGDRAAAARYLDWRWSQIGALAEVLAVTRDRPTLVGCDLNTPGDSPLIGLLRADYRLAFEEAGWGYDYTRPARLPWVGIDHVLASRHFAIVRCWVGPDVGSDHRPVIAEVVLAADHAAPGD